MKLKEKTNDITMTIAKGFVRTFAVNVALFLVIFTFQACSTEENPEPEVTNDSFAKTLEFTTFNLVHNLQLSNVTDLPVKKHSTSELLYLLNLNGQKLANTDFINSIQNLEDLVMARNAYGLDIRTGSQMAAIAKNDAANGQDIPPGEEPVSVHEIDEAEAIAMLQPMIEEARAYLESQGFTQDEIDAMIAENEGTEYDLVLLALLMQELQNIPQDGNAVDAATGDEGAVAMSQGNELTDQEIINCIIIAIGADALWALGGSGASSWAKKDIKRAFKAIAKRFLGPIGVAIAVVSFGLCILNESQD
jgi:hypothetical protein